MRRWVSIIVGTLALGGVLSAQSKDDFAYWDENGNGDLTCSEALRGGGLDGLKLPAYRDDRDGTGLIYEWLSRVRGDSDRDGIDCESNSNPNGYVPTASIEPKPEPTARGCPDATETWMGLRVCEESERSGYDRDAFGNGYSNLEDEIVASLPQADDQVYTPYTCTLFDIEADGTAATDIEHIVALAEAYDSGLAPDRYRALAADLDNLTIAVPSVNRNDKSDRDAGDWTPPQNRGWFADRVVAVKREYDLAVNPAERDALAALLAADASRTVSCADGMEPKAPDEVQAIFKALVEEAEDALNEAAASGSLRAGGPPVTIDMRTLFSFGAGGSADTTYTARSSDPAVVTADTTDGRLVLTPGNALPAGTSSSLAVGARDTLDGDPARATITVTAARAGDTAEVEFTVEVEAAPSPAPTAPSLALMLLAMLLLGGGAYYRARRQWA